MSPVYFHPDPEDSSLSPPPKGIYFAENKRTPFFTSGDKEKEERAGGVDAVGDEISLRQHTIGPRSGGGHLLDRMPLG